jgi:flagellar biosynthesis protein FlhA
MSKIVRNYLLEVLKPVNEDTIKNFRNMKQDRNGMKIVSTDVMRLEIGLSLIPLCDENLQFNLVQKIGAMRKNIEKDTGISIPSIHITSNEYLKQFEYSFYIHGKEMVKYEIKQNKYLCINDGTIKHNIEGKEVTDPVFGVPAMLINKNQIKEAGDAGYVIADASSIIICNIEYLIKKIYLTYLLIMIQKIFWNMFGKTIRY